MKETTFPSIHILRSPKGIHSPSADERCLIYCKQTVGRRTKNEFPICRSLCIRHVFSHEVRRVLATATAGADGEAKKKIPLPKEGQRPAAFLFRSSSSSSNNTSTSTPDASSNNSSPPTKHTPTPLNALRSSSSSSDADADADADATRYWETGTYVWFSRDAVAVTEKVAGMRHSLEMQAGWERYKDRQRAEWRKVHGLPEPPPGRTPAANVPKTSARAGSGAGTAGAGPAPVTGVLADAVRRRSTEKERDAEQAAAQMIDVANPDPTAPLPGEMAPRVREPGPIYYHEYHTQSVLLPVPPPLPPVRIYIAQLLAPTERALGLLVQSFAVDPNAGGAGSAQAQFAARAWEKAVGAEWREPWRLAGRAWERVWKGSGSGEGGKEL